MEPVELVLDERDVEGRKGLAWVGASPRQVLAEREGNWFCPPHFDRDGHPPGTHEQLLPPPTLPPGNSLKLNGQVHERVLQACAP